MNSFLRYTRKQAKKKAKRMSPVRSLEEAFSHERPRLLRWMLSRTGDIFIAEDLVQEIYLEAWRNRSKLIEASGTVQWLNAIAQNIYLRWARQSGKASVYETDFHEAISDPLAEYALERSELASLLDKAMELLPPETRTILLARYLEEQPQAKVARDLGMTESAVAVRLHRGKLALRKVLESEENGEGAWQDTRLWCGVCGKAHYKVKFNSDTGELVMICPNCSPTEEFPAWWHNEEDDSSLVGFKSIKPAFNQAKRLHYEYIAPALKEGHLPCSRCGREARIVLTMPDFVPIPKSHLGLHLHCDHCGIFSYSALAGIGFSSPQAIRYGKDNPRTHLLPAQYLNHQGRAAVLLRVESWHQNDTLDVIFACDTYEILAVYRNEEEDHES